MASPIKMSSPMDKIKDEVEAKTERTSSKDEKSISDIVLRKISEELGAEWQWLGSNLGLNASEIEQIKMDNPGQTQNQIFNMLVRWRRQSTSTDQREVLHTALKEAGRTDIATAQAAGLVLDNIREMQGDEDELRRLLFESGSEELKTCVACESNKDLHSLSYYLQHATPPLEAELFELDVRRQELPLLREILACNNMRLTDGIRVYYHLSEQEKEELSLLQTTLDEVDEQRRAQLHITH